MLKYYDLVKLNLLPFDSVDAFRGTAAIVSDALLQNGPGCCLNLQVSDDKILISLTSESVMHVCVCVCRGIREDLIRFIINQQSF